MDIFEIDVSNKDLEALDADIRLAWEPTGMPCVVASCPASQTIFPTYRGFADHWRQIHQPTKTLSQCCECGQLLSKRHKSQHKKRHARTPLYKELTAPNQSFVDPGNALPPRAPSPVLPDSPRKVAQRYRKRKAEDAIARTAVLSDNLDPDVNNAGDEKLYINCTTGGTTVTHHKNPSWNKRAPVEPLKTKQKIQY
jgi:hypothetical protein